ILNGRRGQMLGLEEAPKGQLSRSAQREQFLVFCHDRWMLLRFDRYDSMTWGMTGELRYFSEEYVLNQDDFRVFRLPSQPPSPICTVFNIGDIVESTGKHGLLMQGKVCAERESDGYLYVEWVDGQEEWADPANLIP